MPHSPEQEFVYDAIFGRVYSLPAGTLLSIGTAPALLTAIRPILSGGIIVRYGIPLASQPDEMIVPGQFVSETGGTLVGREAWRYMGRHFQKHSHAQVFGLYLNGKPAQLFLHQLDFSRRPRVVLYAGLDVAISTAKADGLLIGENAPPVPDFLARYLPAVDDLDGFLNR